ncbi:hypothetical protein M440DRAFT_1028962 [Trichoderma longibrachiatum ATCC 18648]|uniref:Uncharacterized protein n=1 Tax=Trichoderma longibrachiatum ATCC 18648 TaxID=983965 RepID=A0A2T4BZ27_TRILO|nr:hypothetical protein M440DRAFT_1028962 [Trichoderma longibrachiatum ATCC 18648]
MHLFPAFEPSDFGFGPVCNHCPISSRGYLQGVVPWSHYDYLRGKPKETGRSRRNGQRRKWRADRQYSELHTACYRDRFRLIVTSPHPPLRDANSLPLIVSPADGMPLHERSMPVLAAFPQRPYY